MHFLCQYFHVFLDAGIISNLADAIDFLTGFYSLCFVSLGLPLRIFKMNVKDNGILKGRVVVDESTALGEGWRISNTK